MRFGKRHRVKRCGYRHPGVKPGTTRGLLDLAGDASALELAAQRLRGIGIGRNSLQAKDRAVVCGAGNHPVRYSRKRAARTTDQLGPARFSRFLGRKRPNLHADAARRRGRSGAGLGFGCSGWGRCSACRWSHLRG